MPELLVIGEAIVDVVSTATDERAHPGGSPLNVAIGLARLGASVTLATRIGTDANGRMLSRHLAQSGVRLTSGSVDPGIRTSSATATIGADGSAQYEFDISWDVVDLPVSGFGLIHTGSIGALLSPGSEAVAACFDQSEPTVLRSFDPNIRASVLGPRADVLPLVERLARRSSVIKLSDEDASWLHDGLDAAAVSAHYARLGAAIVVVTLGSDGSLVRCGEETAFVASRTVDVVDTIGAGDSYMAGLLHFLTSEIGVDAVLSGRVGLVETIQAARFAADCAAVTVSRPGADLPSLDDVRMLPTATTSPAETKVTSDE